MKTIDMNRSDNRCAGLVRFLATAVTIPALATALIGAAAEDPHRTFPSPEDGVRALADAVRAENLDEVQAIFGPGGKELLASSDEATGRRNRETFTAAVAEGWRLVDEGTNRKTLVIGNEGWPFPVPLVKTDNRWHFDTALGKEEVIARRIGRNELQVIAICRTYVTAQLRYAQEGHDGRPAGLYAKRFRSDPLTQNGLYWPTARGQKRSPLGDLVAQAADEGRPLEEARQAPSPFHGYYFRILPAQGSRSNGGAKSYIVDGEMTGGFALVAWPLQYDLTGIMTFVVNQAGVVRQKDLGSGTDAAARAMTIYNPDASWSMVQ